MVSADFSKNVADKTGRRVIVSGSCPF